MDCVERLGDEDVKERACLYTKRNIDEADSFFSAGFMMAHDDRKAKQIHLFANI